MRSSFSLDEVELGETVRLGTQAVGAIRAKIKTKKRMLKIILRLITHLHLVSILL